MNVWNYFLVNRTNPKAPALISGDGTEMMILRRYLAQGGQPDCDLRQIDLLQRLRQRAAERNKNPAVH